MILSVMTLVDAPEHLLEAYESLVHQTHPTWEWLVVRLVAVDIPPSITDDARVRLLAPSSFVLSQGEAGCKSFAVEEARSTHVVELDQHDFLHPEALAKAAAAIASADPDLLYADFVNVPVSGAPQGYQPEYGWETYGIRHNGRLFQAVRAFDPTPSALYQASYSPSHCLTWRRSAFLKLEGPDPAYRNAGTFDLVCRAYLSGMSFEHMTGCVVYSRQHQLRDRQTDIEDFLSDRYAHDVVVEWSRREGLLRLDLGAARNPAPGFTGVDLHGADINCDIRLGLPVDASSVGCVRAFDFLEHMNHCPDSACTHGADGHPRCVVGVMSELYRALAPGGWLITRTPSTDGRGAFQDPTHTSYWNPNSFWYYTRREQANFLTGSDSRFQAARLWQSYPSPWHETHDILYVHADLVALKGQRQPGICEI